MRKLYGQGSATWKQDTDRLAVVAQVNTLIFMVSRRSERVFAVEISPAVEIDLERAKQDLDLNFWGAVRMVKAFTPLLMQSKEGHIVNISTGASTLPIPYLSMYGSAKAALNHYGDVLRVELAPFKQVRASMAVRSIRLTTIGSC